MSVVIASGPEKISEVNSSEFQAEGQTPFQFY